MTIRFNWGTGITLAYSAFIVLTIAFVMFAMGRPVLLVSDDYYAQSLRQDRRMEAIGNARGLGAGLSLTPTDSRHFVMTLPGGQARSARGTITLYRPSDPRADRVIGLSPDDDGHQQVSFAGMPRGRWLVQVGWTAGPLEYYAEYPVVVE